jgi:glyoxylate carboligase
MPNEQVSDFILERLRAWGVRRIFGYPGDGIDGVIGALRRAGGDFEFVQVANEELAGLMACAHAKYTGEIGVCLSTSAAEQLHASANRAPSEGTQRPPRARPARPAPPSRRSRRRRRCSARRP